MPCDVSISGRSVGNPVPMSTDESLKYLHKALLNFNKRAERASSEILVSNFVDSEPLFDLLSTPNNQVVYGRRGTGKTHALKYLAEFVELAGDHSIYLDLRSIGSNTSIYSDGNRSLTDRASTLIVDVLNALYDEFYDIAVKAIDKAPDPNQLTLRLDDLSSAISINPYYRSRRTRGTNRSDYIPRCRYFWEGIYRSDPLSRGDGFTQDHIGRSRNSARQALRDCDNLSGFRKY